MTVTTSTTANPLGAQEHARAQGNQATNAMPFVPASTFPNIPAGIAPEKMTWGEFVPGGRYTSKVLGRGTRLRIADPHGNACASVMLWRADAPHERLNVADTVKVPWQAYLGVGHPLLSDQGRLLATLVEDTSGHHDSLCGTSTLAMNAARYGDGAAHSSTPAGRELFALAAQKHGLDHRDIPPTLSFFHKISILPDGSTKSVGSAGPGTHIDVVLSMPLIVAIVNAPHPLSEESTYLATTLEVTAWQAGDDLAALAADAHRRDPEYQRAFANTEDTILAATDWSKA